MKILKKISLAFVIGAVYSFFLAFILYGTWHYREDHMLFDLIYTTVMFFCLESLFPYVLKFSNINTENQSFTPKDVLKALFTFDLLSLLLLTFIGIVPFLIIMNGFVAPVTPDLELRLNYAFNLIFASAYFAVKFTYLILINYNNARIKSENLKKENTQARLETLKTQISPHFLFNSLNALSSLIHIDENKAVQFVEQLKEIFLYVTEHKEHNLVELRKEVDFINAYFFLLKTRFRESLHFNLKISAETLNYQLPPLTLQLLVENAIKHNIASKEHPLNIDIISENDHLIVKNNLQKRETRNSTGIGIKNIINRYSHLSSRKVEIELNSNSFIAKIPLINS